MFDKLIYKNIANDSASALQFIQLKYDGSNKTFSFREPTVKETKSFAKTVFTNKDRPSIVYAATLAFIKQLSVEDFDVYKITELERLKILVHILSNIFFSKNLSIKCPRHGCENIYHLSMKYGDLLKCFDKINFDNDTISNNTEIGNVDIKVDFPTTARYLEFLNFIDNEKVLDDYSIMNDNFTEIDSEKSDKTPQQSTSSISSDVIEKIRKRRKILKKQIDKTIENNNDVLGNVDIKTKVNKKNNIIDLSEIYISELSINNLFNTGHKYKVLMNELSFIESEELFNNLPMKLFVTENSNDIFKLINGIVYSKLHEAVPEITCKTCGYQISKKLSLPNFFIYG